MGDTPNNRFKDHFSEVADEYAAYRPRYSAELVEFLAGCVRSAPPTSGVATSATSRHDVAWDCACGSGQLSVPLAERFGRVIATDASGEQLAKATMHPRVEYRQATVDASGLPGASVDLVTVAQAAHWFDLPSFYAEARRVAKPGGVVALICYGIHTIDDAPDPIVRRFYGETLGAFWSPERKHIEDGYRLLPFPFAEFAAPPMVLRASWTLREMLGYVETWSAVWAMVKARGRQPLEAFVAELSHAWGSPEVAREICWPLAMRIGRVDS